MVSLLREVQFAMRALLRAPGFALAAVATLALGIGATTAIFTTVNAALLRPLPYPNPEDLYGLRTTLTDGRVTTGLLSAVEVRRLNEANISIVRAAASTQVQEVTLLRDDATPMKVAISGVSEGFFEMFGLPMTIGGFSAQHYADSGPPVVVLSRRAWRDVYGSDPAIVGRAIRFAEFPPTTIVGVAPQDLDLPAGADFYFNLRLSPTDIGHGLEGYMRIKPGAPLARVEQEMAAVMEAAIRDFPLSGTSRIYVVRPMVEQIVGDLGPILIVVLSAAGVLLVLACVNVTNLLLARGAARAREMAVRVALGASRGRVVRQLLTESCVLATLGAVTGLALAFAGLRLLLAAGASKLPRLDAVAFDGRVLLFALLTLVVSSLIVGFAPALRLAATDLKTLMNESGRSASGGRATTRWLSTLMVAEIALAVVLVAGAGWLVRSFANLRAVDPGFDAGGRILFDIAFNGPKYPNPPAVDAAAQELMGRLRQLPGVNAAGATANFPLRLQPEASLLLQFRGEPFDRDKPMGTRQRAVSPGFFDAMGTTILAGRDFSDADRPDTTPVAIVNATFAQRYLNGRDPIGMHFMSGYPDIDPQSDVEVIGVVEDIRQKSLGEAAEPAFYQSDRQNIPRRRTIVLATGLADPGSLQSAIRAEVAKSDPQIAVNVILLSELTGNALMRQELGMTLMLVFGFAAVALAAVGIYGVIAYATSQRSGEVATRLALGATPRSVFFLVAGHGRTLTIVGALLGLAVAYALGRMVASRLYEVQAADPVILIAATAVVMTIAVMATAVPAARAARTKPSSVLRSE
ncbi:MAG TPA: ABC transporter permease [Vicinamibacterales bacterium]|nr:ABC transporter permease [Vicinamibacterales bacterium]